MPDLARISVANLRLVHLVVGSSSIPPDQCITVPMLDPTQNDAAQQLVVELSHLLQNDERSTRARLWRNLGSLYWMTGDTTEAESAFKSSLKLGNDEIAQLGIGELDALQGRYADAVRGMSTLGYAPDIVAQRADRLLFAQGNYGEALRCYDLAISWIADSYRAHFGRARALQLLGRNYDALTEIGLAIDLCSTCAMGYVYRGQIRLAEGFSIDMVEADYRKALSLAPVDPDIQLTWAYWLASQGRWNEAQLQTSALVQSYPERLEPYVLLVNIYRGKGDLDAAVNLMRTMQSRFPESPQLTRLWDEIKQQLESQKVFP